MKNSRLRFFFNFSTSRFFAQIVNFQAYLKFQSFWGPCSIQNLKKINHIIQASYINIKKKKGSFFLVQLKDNYDITVKVRHSGKSNHGEITGLPRKIS